MGDWEIGRLGDWVREAVANWCQSPLGWWVWRVQVLLWKVNWTVVGSVLVSESVNSPMDRSSVSAACWSRGRMVSAEIVSTAASKIGMAVGKRRNELFAARPVTGIGLAEGDTSSQ